MAYTKVNIDAQLKRYSDIRNVGGVECITDVYARSSLQPNIYWFTAKVARCTGTYCLQILKLKIQCSVIVDDKLLVGCKHADSSFGFASCLCLGTVSVEEAVNRQWNLLEEHIVRLRPVELGRSFGSIEFWTAPGDSELACANNELPLQLVKKLSTTVSAKEVGANLEVVTNKGVGFHVERAEDGSILDAFE